MRRVFGFPNPVNEKAARVVAGVVALLALLTLPTGWYWPIPAIAYGFWARVLTGPTLSPLGRLATSVVAARLGPPHYVSGPPKRFAQGMGAVITTVAAVAALGFGSHAVADGLLVAMVAAAALESVFALCIGCRIFAVLMRIGVVPDDVCAECSNIWARRPAEG